MATRTQVVKFIRKGDKGDDGTNYLIPVWWDSSTKYEKTQFGVPVVLLEDGTTLGYSAYELLTDSSTVGQSPATTPSEWRVLESTKYIYILNAYIKQLQAQLVTAERIEALMIRTQNLEVLDGAKIGGLQIIDGNLTSSYSKSEIIWDYSTHPPTYVGTKVVSGSIKFNVDSVEVEDSYSINGLPNSRKIIISPTGVSVINNALLNTYTTSIERGGILVQYEKFHPSGNTSESVEVRSDGIYRNGNKIL